LKNGAKNRQGFSAHFPQIFGKEKSRQKGARVFYEI
jgi:hypothetical protein